MVRRVRASNPRKATSPEPEPVEVRNIAHPGLWKTAMKISGNKKDAIVVESWSRLQITL